MSLSFGFRKSARKWRREKLGQCRSKLPRILRRSIAGQVPAGSGQDVQSVHSRINTRPVRGAVDAERKSGRVVLDGPSPSRAVAHRLVPTIKCRVFHYVRCLAPDKSECALSGVAFSKMTAAILYRVVKIAQNSYQQTVAISDSRIGCARQLEILDGHLKGCQWTVAR